MMLALLCCLIFGAVGLSAEPAALPQLDVWCVAPPPGNDYPNERAFWSAYQSDAEFRAALNAHFRIRRLNIRQNIVVAMTHGITCGPTFAVDGRPLIKGFRGAQVLLAELGITRPAQAGTPPAMPARPETPDRDLSGLKADLAQATLHTLEESAQKLREERSQAIQETAQTLRNERRQQLEQLQQQLGGVHQRATEAQQQASQAQQRMDVLQQAWTNWDQRISSAIQNLVESSAPPPIRTADPPAGWWRTPVNVLGWTLSIAQLAGIGVVTGGSVPLAWVALKGVSAVWRMCRRPSQSQAYQAVPLPSPVPPARQVQGSRPAACPLCPELKAQNKSLKDQVRVLQAAPPSSPMFAPYETDQFREAYEWACREMVRKYPGSVGNLDSLKHLIEQYIASKRKGS